MRWLAGLLIVAAAAIELFFVSVHWLGLRDRTAVIAGELASLPGDPALGVLYAVSWFAAVLAAPILVLAGGTIWLGSARD